MGVDFDWTYEKEEPPFSDDEKGSVSRGPGRKIWWIALAIVAMLLVGLAWAITYKSAITADPQLEAAVRAYLELEQRAVQSGNGDLFFSLQADDPAWRATQLQPVNQAFNAADRDVIDIERRGDDVRVTIVTDTDLTSDGQSSGEQVERMAFYHWVGGVLERTATDPAFWGEKETLVFEWGQLVFHERDRDGAAAMGDLINETVERLCTPGCPANRLPVTVTIAPDFGATAAPGHVRVPSPRLLGRDAGGMPADPFVDALHARLTDYLTPATIRIGVPARQAEQYQATVEEFRRLHPQISVVITPLANGSIPTAADLDRLDGILAPPPADLIATGQVLDLTDFAATDPMFRENDFHPLALTGARWRERLWMMPISAQTPVLIIDADAYGRANLTPESPLNWGQLEQDVAAVMTTTGNEQLQWGFVDLGNDSLFAYALGEQCPENVTRSCRARLGRQAVASALIWYRRLVMEEEMIPDITGLDYQERLGFALNNQSNPREIAAWIDRPVSFEHHIQIAPLAVYPIPGLNGRQLTPVQVAGGFITAHSEHPRAVWAWLNFLSRQRPVDQPRALPARISVTGKIDYWGQLPYPLQAPVRDSLRNARPIRLDEQQIFRLDDLARLLAGEVSPEEMAEEWLEIEWFEDQGVTR